MKKTTFLFIAMVMVTISATAGTGWFNDFLTLKVNGVETPNNYYIGADPTTGALPFQGAAFGAVTSLELSDINLKYWADNGDTRDGGALYYKIMSADGSTEIVAPFEIVWAHASIGGNDYQGLKPGYVTGSMSFLRGLPTGSYQLHIWAKSWGTGGDSYLSNAGANYVATFSVYKPIIVSGASGIDNNSSFATLKEAVDSLNAHPDQTAGDIEIKIAGNTTEPANFGLAVNTGTKKIIIRPDADADRVITFTQTAANLGPWGHFVIGYATANLGAAIAEASLQNTNNVTIDGFAVGGSTRRLKLTTSATAIANSTLTTIVGGCSNITIKNCIYETKSTTATPRCINLFAVKNGTKDVAPSNILIDNNEIYSNPSSTINGTAIQCTATGSATAIIENLDITNNKIIASSTGIEIRFVNGVDITGNEIKMQKGTQTGGIYGIWLRGTSGDMNIFRNKFTETSTNQASGTVLIQTISTAANASNPFNVNIFNNTFSGMDRKATGATAINQCYIGDSGYGTTKVYNNSFYLPLLTQPTQTGYYHAFKFTGSLKAADIQNNIFISNEDSKSVLISDPITSGTMNNNIYYLRAGNSNARVVGTYETLALFKQNNPTLDVHSKSVNVNFVDAAAGNLLLTGLSIQDVNLKVPSLAAVTNDILETIRNTSFTYAGAHESILPFPTTGLDKALMQAGVQISKAGIYIPVNETSSIELYTLNGMLIDRAMVNNSYSRALNNGAYIVKINGKATKFVK